MFRRRKIRFRAIILQWNEGGEELSMIVNQNSGCASERDTIEKWDKMEDVVLTRFKEAVDIRNIYWIQQRPGRTVVKTNL